MKALRTPFWIKSLAAFLILNLMFSIVYPQLAHALTSGPHQPEYVTYEEPGSNDLVNLLTGDFSFTLPILEVPGPEGGFTMPLAYHGGIRLEQEASWVGLGWSLNPGAITRDIIEFPDDASGESRNIQVADLTGVTEVSRTYVGLFTQTDNSLTGRSGSFSLFGIVEASWDEDGLNSIGIAGFNFSRDGFSFDPVSFATTALAIVSAGLNKKVEGVLGFVKQQVISHGAALGIGSAIESFSSGNFNAINGSLGFDGYWQQSISFRRDNYILFSRNTTRIWLNQSRNEHMYGVLNIDKAPQSNISGLNYDESLINNLNLSNNNSPAFFQKPYELSSNVNSGSASDVIIHIGKNQNYDQNFFPFTLGYDNFSVKGLGISGGIQPKRLEIGSVMPGRDMTYNHIRLSGLSYMDYKVPFVYKGTHSNMYMHLMGTNYDENQGDYGINYHTSGSGLNSIDLNIALQDAIFRDDKRVPNEVNQTKKIAQGNNINWFTNEEIYAQPNPIQLQDFLFENERPEFRKNVILPPESNVYSTYVEPHGNNSTVYRVFLPEHDLSKFSIGQTINAEAAFYDPDDPDPNGYYYYQNYNNLTIQAIQHGYLLINFNHNNLHHYFQGLNITLSNTSWDVEGLIGGFAITRSDGTTFHYALPTYNSGEEFFARNVSDHKKFTRTKRDQPFAGGWLLTGITGPDYIDRNNNGVIDDEDWGYWVRFNYGRDNQTFQWRMPFQNFQITPDNQMESYSQGFRQNYYLNSIQTRSHTAIFLKSERLDGNGADNLGRSLRLDEIVLLNNKNYKLLTSPGNGYGLSPCFGTLNLKWWTNNLSQAIRNFLDKYALSRIKLNYDYSLCRNTLNSNAPGFPGKGKLTLNSIEMLGQDGIKTVPDYSFEYGHNPNYHLHRWDGWGMYNPSGNAWVSSHFPHSTHLQPSAWSLTGIKTPLGNTIKVEYERDDYSSIAGNQTYLTTPFGNIGYMIDRVIVNNPDEFSVGDEIQIEGYVMYNCSSCPQGDFAPPCYDEAAPQPEIGEWYYPIDYQVRNIIGKQNDGALILDAPLAFENICSVFNYNIAQNQSFQAHGTIARKENRKGGDLRVSKIITSDNTGKAFVTKYIYTLNEETDGRSAGVISMEPDYCRRNTYNFFDLPGYPFLPVMYEKVSVLSGYKENGNYSSKTVYNFETIKSNFINVHTNNVISNTTYKTGTYLKVNIFGYYESYPLYEKIEGFSFTINNQLSKIGSIKSILTKNNQDHLTQSQTFKYETSDLNNQGIYTDGALVFDYFNGFSTTGQEKSNLFKITRTTEISRPNYLKEITFNNEGKIAKQINEKWDFYTGKVLEKRTESPLGLKSRSVIVPAYHKYPEMGPVGINPSNKNMLSQEAASFHYLLNDNNDPTGVLGASVTTWKNNALPYRAEGAQSYENQTESSGIWKAHQNYIYEGSYQDMQEDGSLALWDDEVFYPDPSQSSGWRLMGEFTLFSKNSHVLESRDHRNIYSTSKSSPDGIYPILSASNSRYTEVAWAGSEFEPVQLGTNTFLETEVQLGNGAEISDQYAHTGQKSIRVSQNGNFGLTYKLNPGDFDFKKPFRAMVWIHESAKDHGILEVERSPTSGPVQHYTSQLNENKKAGEWYQLEVVVPPGNDPGSSLFFYTKKTGGTAPVYFDDFIVKPLHASIGITLIDPETEEIQYQIGNDGKYVRYEYENGGLIEKVFIESFKHGETIVTETIKEYTLLDN